MYLVTGATGFIGKHVMGVLLRRGERVFALVREGSRERLRELASTRWGVAAERVIPVVGDITRPACGLDARTVRRLKASVEHVVHLAAVYDLDADLETARAGNVDGTRHVVQLANQLDVRLHHVSSIAVAGEYAGLFREDMYDEGQRLPHPYFLTKFEAEGIVRREANGPVRVYRPGIVIGSAATGEAEKIDGPYYAFKLIQRLRGVFPEWLPLLGIEGGQLNLVPVDFVAQALDAILHQEGLDGRTFHLVDPRPLSFGDAMNEFCKAAHAPQFTARIDRKVLELMPRGVLRVLGSLPMVRAAREELLADWGIPASALPYINWRATFDARETEAALRGTGVECPPLPSYAWRIWDYWERHLDPDLFRDRTLSGAVRDKVVLVTGASSGIGRSLALKLGRAGATTLLVARSSDKLRATQEEIEAAGGRAAVYACDLSVPERVDDLLATVLREHGHVDVLVNNAGRSIRRSVKASFDRFHDFQRTMNINYFGALKLILGLLPRMCERRSGHIVNVSSIGVQTNVPRFSAYVASKAALDAFSKCIASEVISDRVYVSTVYMPLVRTPMIEPTKIYESLPAISPEEAADLVVAALLGKPKRVSTRLGTLGEVLYAVAPRVADRVLNVGYQLFPESQPRGETPVSSEGVAFGHLLRGIHW